MKKKISLERLTSRLPSIWPAYVDGELWYVNEERLPNGRQNTYVSNYGMVPLNIVLAKHPSQYADFQEVEILTEWQEGDAMPFVLSFERLQQWYRFFTEYYRLLNDYGHCGRTYYSAVDYYNYESGTKYLNQMVYGPYLETYEELDRLFVERGGVPEFQCYNRDSNLDIEWLSLDEAIQQARVDDKNDSINITEARDRGFFRWICTNIVPSFEIPLKYREYWKRKTLFYPDVVRWLGWFQTRQQIYTNTWEVNQCSGETVQDCCDCEEYFNRGGEYILELMKEWYENVQRPSKEVVDITKNPLFIPSLVLSTHIETSIENLGELSILAEEYKLGTDYRVSSGLTASANTKGGTVVSVSGDSMILKDKKSGFTFNPTLMEKEFDSESFTPYLDEYIKNGHQDEFNVQYHWYAFSEDGQKWLSTYESEESVIADLNTQYQTVHTYEPSVNKYGWIIVNGTLYEIEHHEYGIMQSSGHKIPVFRQDYTNTPYVHFNGQVVYGTFNQGCYTFPFFNQKFKRLPSTNNTDYFDYISYNGGIQEVSESGVTINSDEYYRVSSYADISGQTVYYVPSKLGICAYNAYVNDCDVLPNYQLANGKYMVSYDGEWELYPIDKLQGQTVSKIYDLRCNSLLVDDAGFTIEGVYDLKEGKNYAQPPEGTALDPMYQVGNIANLSQFSETIIDEDELVSADSNTFIGDIITRMDFYYKDTFGQKVGGTMVSVQIDDENGPYYQSADGNQIYGQYLSLSAITQATEQKADIENNGGTIFDEDVYCDITYYMGATLQRKRNKSFYSLKPHANHGIQYKESVKFVKVNQEYYLETPKPIDYPSQANDVSAHSISYPIMCYKMEQEMVTIHSSLYDTDFEVALANFTTDINVYQQGNGWSYDNYGDMEDRNGLDVYPTFREEYRLAQAVPQSVDSNIYIERGINPAFEKHLKLGEVTSLEALLQYGNGYFKTMEN